MKLINMIMFYYWDTKFKRRLHVLEADIIPIKKNINLMSLAQRIRFLLDVLQVAAIALVSVINHRNSDGLHLFWDAIYNDKKMKNFNHKLSF